MRVKRLLIVGLVALNLALLSGLIVLASHLPTALAQSGRGSGKYVSVTATYTAGTDALYILNTSTGQMVALTPGQGGRNYGQLVVSGQRDDVKADLGQ